LHSKRPRSNAWPFAFGAGINARGFSNQQCGTNRLRIAISILLVAVNVIFAYDVILFEHHHVHGENALLENLQACFLALGTLLFLLPTQTNAANSFLNKAFSLLCLSFLLRELDLERFGVPPIIAQLGSGNGRKLLLAVLWVLLSVTVPRLYEELAETNAYFLMLILGVVRLSRRSHLPEPSDIAVSFTTARAE